MEINVSATVSRLPATARSVIPEAGRVPPRPTVPQLIMTVLTEFAAWQNRARQRRHLAGLDDYMLRDIGLSRADVHREISKPVWRP